MWHLLALLVALAPLLPALAQGDPRITHLTRQLTGARDVRVRAQSALVLGNTDDPEALSPLCTGLRDDSGLVRAAAAKALAALKEPGGTECLRAHARDPDGDARRAILEALRALEQPRSARARFYLAFGGVADRSAGLPEDLRQLTEARLRRSLASRGALLAPPDESRGAARAALQRLRVSGFWLRAEVHAQPGGGLRLALVCMTYPDRVLLGQVEVKATGARPADLLRALAPRAIEEAAQTFEWSD
jgi:HEAT repeat protein